MPNGRPSLGLTRKQAAAELGLSLSHFLRFVYPDLKVVRLGRRVIVPRSELEHWLDFRAERTLE
jgi:predicted DNA-binding transcriptional regulator AlpA